MARHINVYTLMKWSLSKKARVDLILIKCYLEGNVNLMKRMKSLQVTSYLEV